MIGAASSLQGECVLNMPMNISGNSVSANGKSFTIFDQKGAMQIAGIDGNAWRTDGHTSFMSGNVGTLVNGNQMTASVVFAIDTNVIIAHDDNNADVNGWAPFVDCLNGNSGFAFMLSRRGAFGAKVYVGGQPVQITSNRDAADGKLQLWQWNQLTLTVDGTSIKLFLNGNLVGERKASSTGVKVQGELVLGRDRNNNTLYCDFFRMGDFNGAIDDLRIYTDAITPAAFSPAFANLNLPANRYANDKLRAKYHGQPGLNWTNETHGLLYNPKDGKYHVIYQRTGSVPGMSHAHYGHITSSDLINWEDDKPMIWPSENFDRRGCWSGCLFTDPKINGGKPAIIYTGVGFGGGESYANIAFCDDDVNLRSWHKTGLGNPIRTYSNTQRDTYFFRVDDNNAYFIIGDDGCMKSYKYNQSNGSWIDNGNFYEFQAGETGFTEMPNVAQLPNGKWLMTFTPWTGSVKCIYRIGDINAQGKFVNFGGSELFDFFANDGFCLMSPSIGKDKNGDLTAIGIVADKMPTQWNMEKGYAHLYSLPRTLGVDAQGRLTQKPFNGYEKMFGSVKYQLAAPETLNGTKSVNPVRGRQAEVCATFTVGDNQFGINFLQNPNGKGGKITYRPSDHTVLLDVAAIVGGDYGMKTASYPLPVYPAKGEDFKMQLFIDHSVCDLFINDRYATSFRVFPDNSMENDLIEVFSNGATTLKALTAHMVGAGDCRDQAIEPYEFLLPENSGKVAFLKDATSMSSQEQAALDFYTGSLKLNNVIATNEVSKIKASAYDCIWIHIDRKNIGKGAGNLPAGFISTEMLNALKQFVKDGGNLYLSGHATQMLQSLGRIPAKFAPNEFSDGNGAQGADEWTVNPKLADKYDHKGHAIYKNMKVSDAFSWTTYGILLGNGGSILREDHNCMWKLSDFTYTSTAADYILKFEEDNAASVLGTWGQERTDGWAGIVEFYPYPTNDDNTAWSGSIIANGMAAFQWSVEGPGNADFENLRLLTGNVFSYLANKNGVKPDNPKNPGNDDPSDPSDSEEPTGPEVPESTGKVAFLCGYNSASEASANREENAALQLFRKQFPKGTVVYADNYSSISADIYDMVWIHLDRDGIAQGWQQLPAPFNTANFINVMKNYVNAGGNLYLSKHAAQLVVGLGRMAEQQGIYSSGNGAENSDDWQVNVAADTDHSSHAIFYGIPVHTVDHGKVIDLIGGSTWRMDHNVMWDNISHTDFTRDYDCKVLGTWGHNGGQNAAGIVEFHPVSAAAAPNRAVSADEVANRRGTILVNGLAAYELAPKTGANPYQANVEALTKNTIGYLSPLSLIASGDDVIDASTSRISFSAANGAIYINGIATPTIVSVYTTDGSLLLRAEVTTDTILPLAATPGVLIVEARPLGTAPTVTKLTLR